MATTIQSTGIGATASNAPGAWARYCNAAVGVWLFISGLVLRQPQDARLNAWIVGVLVVCAAIWALFSASARFINSVLAVWLLFSSFALFRLTNAPLWNDVIVAIVVFALSLVPNEGGRRQRPAAVS